MAKMKQKYKIPPDSNSLPQFRLPDFISIIQESEGQQGEEIIYHNISVIQPEPSLEHTVSTFSSQTTQHETFPVTYLTSSFAPVTLHPHFSESFLTTSSPTPTTTIVMSQGASGCSVPTIDVSGFNYPRVREQMELWEVLLKCCVVGVLLLVAVVGNVLIIVIVSLSKKMRTTTNYYIVNLAIADLMVACFPMWIYVTTNVTDGWILGGFLCKFNAFVQTSAMCVISFTMMAIAGDRFFAIVFPLKARITHRKVKVVVVLVWLAGVSIGVPPLVFYTYTERQWKDYLETFCGDVWPMVERSDGTCDQGVTSERVYWTVVVAVLNWIPMVMMSVNYLVIIYILQFSRVSHRGSEAMSSVQRRSSRRVIKMLFTLLITFMVCTLPFQVSTIYDNYKDRQQEFPPWYQPVYFSAIVLMYSHSTFNPIVYGAMNQTFRKGFMQLVNRCRGRKLNGWESQMTVLESARTNVAVVQDDPGPDQQNLKELIRASSYLNKAVLLDGLNEP